MNIITGTTGLTLNDIALTRENGDLCFFADSVASIDVSLFFSLLVVLRFTDSVEHIPTRMC